MATDDCSEYASGPCPCGAGVISIEVCVPDHPWAKSHQASYTAALACEECRKIYTIHAPAHELPMALVLKADSDKLAEAQDKWHAKLREIEATSGYLKLKAALDAHLLTLTSAAARYRFLVGAGLVHSSLATYRKNSSYWLSGRSALRAIKALGLSDPEIEKKSDEAEQLWKDAHGPIESIPTGIRGFDK
jgi:hypothetical protein